MLLPLNIFPFNELIKIDCTDIKLIPQDYDVGELKRRSDLYDLISNITDL